MKGEKRILLASVFTLLVLTLISFVSAADITITAPLASGLVNGTYNFTATVTGYNNTRICQFSYTGTTSGNIGNNSIGSGTTACSMTNLSSVITDASGYTINVTLINTTASANPVMIYSTTVTSISVDNNAPNTPTITLQRKSIEPRSKQVVSCSGSDTTDSSLTYSLVLTKPDTTTDTQASSSYTWRDTTLASLGIYTVACTVTDDGALSSSSSTTFKTSSDDIEDTQQMQVITQIQENKEIIIFFAVLVIIVIAMLVVLMTTGKGKKKRK